MQHASTTNRIPDEIEANIEMLADREPACIENTEEIIHSATALRRFATVTFQQTAELFLTTNVGQ
jgi:hypothetical protein